MQAYLRELVQTAGAHLFESGLKRRARRLAPARVPRLEGLPRRSRMTRKWDAHLQEAGLLTGDSTSGKSETSEQLGTGVSGITFQKSWRKPAALNIEDPMVW